ncbi:hypothetical protein M3Y99_00385800 [Aphelenchoides fujianensis]|nr:hypothetical protein M3Y99_00385800 [Aphelenchoides fujianensis]
MSDATSSWGPLAARLLNAEQKAEVAVVRGCVLREASSGKPSCKACGVECPNGEELDAHAAAHEQADGEFGCAICGLQFDAAKTRNVHEHTLHKFQRYPADDQKNGAVSVSKGQLLLLENVGFLFGAIQAAAAASSHPTTKDAYLLATPAEILQKMEQSTGHKSKFVCSGCGFRFPRLNNRIFHEKCHREGVAFQCSACEWLVISADLRNEHEGRVHALERPLQTLHWKEAVKIPTELHSELLRVGMNFELIQQRAVDLPRHPSIRLLEKREPPELPPERPVAPLSVQDGLLERLWARFVAASPVFASTCGELPLFRWIADSRCELLLLRSAKAEWRREPRALENFVFLRLPLEAASSPSFVLCFCKPTGAPLAARLVAPAANCRSVRQLLELVAASGQSALIVVRPEDRSAIRHLETGDFVVI